MESINSATHKATPFIKKLSLTGSHHNHNAGGKSIMYKLIFNHSRRRWQIQSNNKISSPTAQPMLVEHLIPDISFHGANETCNSSINFLTRTILSSKYNGEFWRTCEEPKKTEKQIYVHRDLQRYLHSNCLSCKILLITSDNHFKIIWIPSSDEINSSFSELNILTDNPSSNEVLSRHTLCAYVRTHYDRARLVCSIAVEYKHCTMHLTFKSIFSSLLFAKSAKIISLSIRSGSKYKECRETSNWSKAYRMQLTKTTQHYQYYRTDRSLRA